MLTDIRGNDELRTVVTMGTAAANKEDLRGVVDLMVAGLTVHQLRTCLKDAFSRISHAEYVIGLLVGCEEMGNKRTAPKGRSN